MRRYAQFKVFSLVFGVIYTVFFYIVWAPFRYFPIINEFHVAEQPPSAGPVILWYGWLAGAAVVSAAIAVATPRSWADRLWHGWSWIVPAALLVGIFVYEKRWFI